MNITLSIDARVVEAARKIAAQRGTSLNQMIRDHLTGLTALGERESVVEELEELWETAAGDSRGQRWTREEIHERS